MKDNLRGKFTTILFAIVLIAFTVASGYLSIAPAVGASTTSYSFNLDSGSFWNGYDGLQVRDQVPIEMVEGNRLDEIVIDGFEGQDPLHFTVNMTTVPVEKEEPEFIVLDTPEPESINNNSSISDGVFLGSSTAVFSENFEGAFPGDNWHVGDWTSDNGDDYWADTSYRHHGGSWSGWCADIGDNSVYGGTNYANRKYDNGMDAYLLKKQVVDMSSWDIGYIDFWAWFDTESCCDYVIAEWYGNDALWHQDFNFRLFGSGTSWSHYYWRVPDDYLISQGGFGFKFHSDSSIVYEGAYLDDIYLYNADVTLDNYYLDPTLVQPDGTFTMYYYIHNPAPFTVDVSLGASIRDSYGNGINDESNDITVSLSPGYNWKSRPFHVPSDASNGLYDVAWGIWSDTPGSANSRSWGFSGWQEDTLTVEGQAYYYLRVTNNDPDSFPYVYFDIDNNHGWNSGLFPYYISVGGYSTGNSVNLDATTGWHTAYIMWYDYDYCEWQHKELQEYISIGETQEYAFTLPWYENNIESVSFSPTSPITVEPGAQVNIDAIVGLTACRDGILQSYIYDGGSNIDERDWIYIPSSQSTVRTLNLDFIAPTTLGTYYCDVYTQFRPGATSGPLDSTIICDMVQTDSYTVIVEEPTYWVYGIIDDFIGGTDLDGDGYYETYDFYIGIDGDVSTDYTKTVYGKMICTTTGQSWWSASPWTISGTATDYQYFSFDETDFAGHFSGNIDLDFTVELWNQSKTTKLATDTSVLGEPVKVDYLEKQQTRIVGDRFVNKTAKIGIPLLLESHLQRYDWFIWWNLAGQAIHFDIYYSGQWHEIPDDGIASTSFVTDNDGIASVYYTAPKTLAPGSYSIRARYDGSTAYEPCSLTRTLTIAKPAWIMMYYLAHGNDLDSYAQIKKNDIDSATSNDNFQAFVLWDRLNSNDTDYLYSMNDGDDYTWTGPDIGLPSEFDMGDPITLVTYVDWVMDRCPADHYALIPFDHGSGVIPTGPEEPMDPMLLKICSDGTSYLSVYELGVAVDSIKLMQSRNMDAVHLDACLMQMIEVNYQMSNSVSYIVASENEGWALGSNSYEHDYLEDITMSTQPLSLALAIAQAYDARCDSGGLPHTISVLAQSETGNVVTELNDLANALIEDLYSIHPELDTIRTHIQKFDSNGNLVISDIDDFLDLEDLAIEMENRSSSTSVQTAASALRSSIGNEGGSFVKYEEHLSGSASGATYDFSDGTYGVSIFWPSTADSTYDNYIDNSPTGSSLTLCWDTAWDDFLVLYFDETDPTCQITAPNSGGWYAEDIGVTAAANDENGIRYVEFQYSVDHVNWYALPGPDSADGRDWYGDNGWGLTFRTTDTPQHGTITDSTVWVRARAVDKAGNDCGWDECDVSFGVDNTVPYFSAWGHTIYPMPGTYEMLQAILDDHSGVRDDAIYPRFYYKWNDSTIDQTHYDGIAVGNSGGSFYVAAIDIGPEHVGDTIYWRVRAHDNVDNENWSDTHHGGVIQDNQPEISVTPASRDFGPVEMGSYADATFTVENIGGGTLVGAASVPAPFNIQSGGSYSLTSGQTQIVTVRFSPSAAQPYSETVTFTGGSGATRPVTGTGVIQPEISVTPASRDFGPVEVGSYADATFTVENIGGGTLVGVASVPAPFNIQSGGSYSLTSGQTQIVTVRFSPSAAQPYSETVTFTGGSGAARPVTGTGVIQPEISISSFTATPDKGFSPLPITFTTTWSGGTGTFDIQYNWGDGTTPGSWTGVTSPDIRTHIYTSAGVYTCTVTITDTNDMTTDHAAVDVGVDPKLVPVPEFPEPPLLRDIKGTVQSLIVVNLPGGPTEQDVIDYINTCLATGGDQDKDRAQCSQEALENFQYEPATEVVEWNLIPGLTAGGADADVFDGGGPTYPLPGSTPQNWIEIHKHTVGEAIVCVWLDENLQVDSDLDGNDGNDKDLQICVEKKWGEIHHTLLDLDASTPAWDTTTETLIPGGVEGDCDNPEQVDAGNVSSPVQEQVADWVWAEFLMEPDPGLFISRAAHAVVHWWLIEDNTFNQDYLHDIMNDLGSYDECSGCGIYAHWPAEPEWFIDQLAFDAANPSGPQYTDNTQWKNPVTGNPDLTSTITTLPTGEIATNKWKITTTTQDELPGETRGLALAWLHNTGADGVIVVTLVEYPEEYAGENPVCIEIGKKNFSGSQPAVTTNPATDVTPTSAILNGTLDSLGSASYMDVYFEIGYDTSYGYTFYADTLTTPGPFSYDIPSGLSPGTTYHYRAMAVGDDGTIVYGDDVSFTYTYVLPAVTTNPATDVTPTSAILNGTLDSLGSASYVDVYFVAGLDTNYTYVVYVDRMTLPGSFSYHVPSGLSPGTTYHYAAALVDNSGVVVYGNDVTFSYILPTVTTNPATDVTPTSATLNGEVDSLGSASYVDVYFVAGLDTNYTYVVYVDRITLPGSFSYHVPSGLSPGTTYHYAAALVDNSGVVVYGNDVSFTTGDGS